MTTAIDSVVQQTRRYWYEDGLAEIAAGGVLAAVGLLFALEALAPADWRRVPISALGLPLVVILGSWLASAIVRIAKERVTYPRTGYVRYPRPSRRRRGLAGFVAGAAAALVVLWLLRWGAHGREWIPALDGLAVGAMLAYIGYLVGLGRFHALAAASVVIGVAAALRAPNEIVGSAWFFAATGAAVAIVGLTVLARYMRRTRPAGNVDRPDAAASGAAR